MVLEGYSANLQTHLMSMSVWHYPYYLTNGTLSPVPHGPHHPDKHGHVGAPGVVAHEVHVLVLGPVPATQGLLLHPDVEWAPAILLLFICFRDDMLCLLAHLGPFVSWLDWEKLLGLLMFSSELEAGEYAMAWLGLLETLVQVLELLLRLKLSRLYCIWYLSLSHGQKIENYLEILDLNLLTSAWWRISVIDSPTKSI